MACIIAMVFTLALAAITFPYMAVVFGENAYSPCVLLCKLLQVTLLFAGSYAVARLLVLARSGKALREPLFLFLAFLAVHIVALICIYPGGWRWDDVGVLNGLMSNPTWSTWQCYLTPVFYTVCMITVPAPAFIVFVQVAIISGVGAYVGWRMNVRFGSRAPSIVILVLSMLPPMLNMDLYPLRNGLHAWLEILVFFAVVDRCLDRRQWSVRSAVALAVLSAIVCVWRTECVVFVVLIPVVFWFLNRDITASRVIVVFAVCCVAFTGALSAYQIVKSSPEYSVTAYVPALPALAHRALQDGDEAFLAEFDRAYNSEVLDEAYEQGVSGEVAYWNQSEWPVFRVVDKQGRDREYYSLCREEFMRAVLKYPDTFLKVRLEILGMQMNGRWSAGKTGELFISDKGALSAFRELYMFNKQISPELRSLTASYMETDQDWSRWFSFTYSLAIPLVFYLVAYAWSLLRRPKLVIALLAFNVHHVILFLTSPAYIFMYYYSFYLGGLLIGVAEAFYVARILRGRISPVMEAAEGLVS